MDIDLGDIRIGIDIGIPIWPPVWSPVWPDSDADPYPTVPTVVAMASPTVPAMEAMAAVEAMATMEAMAAAPMPTAAPRVPWDGTGEEHRGQDNDDPHPRLRFASTRMPVTHDTLLYP